MIIDRRPSRHPRQGPSCTLLLAVLFAIGFGAYIVVARETVRDVLLPDPTPTPTRSAATYAAKGSLQERDGEWAEAIASYQAAVQLAPNYLEYYLPLVRLLIKTRALDEALVKIEQAAELDENNNEIFSLWAAAQLEFGDRLSDIGQPTDADLAWQEAVRLAGTAIDLNPNNAEAYAIRAAAWVRLGPEWFDQANEDAEIAVALEGNNPTVRRHMATVLENQGYYNQAIEQYEIALSIEPNSADLLIGLARNYWAKNNIPEAILTFEDALEVDPNNADAYDGLGYMYFLIGEYPRAEENFIKAVEFDETMVRARAHLGAARFRQQNYEGDTGAIPHLEWAVEQYREVSIANAVYFNMLGLAYFYTSGECSQARPLFEQVLATVPDEPNSLYGLDLCFEADLNR